MSNGIVIGLAILTGVWMGWYAVPICAAVVVITKLIELDPNRALILTAIICASIGAFRSTEPPSSTTNPDFMVSTGAIGTVSSFPRPTASGHRILLNVSEVCAGEQCVESEGIVLVYVPEQRPPVARGQILRLDWDFSPLQELERGYRNYVSSTGAVGSARASRVVHLKEGPLVFEKTATLNQSVTARFQEFMPGDTGALASGIVTGDDSALSPTAKEDFRVTGTSHLTAVSGQNVSLIVGFLSLWYTPRTTLGRAAFHIGLILSVWSYATFVGLEAPAMRAAIVATLTILGRHSGRTPDPVTILSLALGGMALINPLHVHTVGFWLSASASMALCLVLPNHIRELSAPFVLKLSLAPIVASLATMPISLFAFGTWSPIGILANIVISPLVTLIFPLAYGYAVLGSAFPGIASSLAWIPGPLLDFVLDIVRWMAPVASQIRIDTLSTSTLVLLWIPIVVGVWLLSGESNRWLRRVLLLWSNYGSAKSGNDSH